MTISRFRSFCERKKIQLAASSRIAGKYSEARSRGSTIEVHVVVLNLLFHGKYLFIILYEN